MKRKVISSALAVALILSNNSFCVAKETIPATKILDIPKTNKNVFAYQRPDIMVKMNDNVYIFRDAKLNKVYPLVYAGTTYLPVRAIANMLQKNIDWEQSNKTVYIGRSLQNPEGKIEIDNGKQSNCAIGIKETNFKIDDSQMEQVSMQIREDIRIMYDFEEKQFSDEGGLEVYPVIFNNSTYLPLRAVSKLMNKDIDWNQSTKTIQLSDMISTKGKLEKEKQEHQLEEDKKLAVEELQKKQAAEIKKEAKAEFERLCEIHKLTTDNLVALRHEEDTKKQAMYVDVINKIVSAFEASKLTANIYKRENLTQNQNEVVKALKDYSQTLVHYTLIMENIAYLSATGQDFSVFSETFVNFAVMAQKDQQTCKTSIEALK